MVVASIRRVAFVIGLIAIVPAEAWCGEDPYADFRESFESNLTVAPTRIVAKQSVYLLFSLTNRSTDLADVPLGYREKLFPIEIQHADEATPRTLNLWNRMAVERPQGHDLSAEWVKPKGVFHLGFWVCLEAERGQPSVRHVFDRPGRYVLSACGQKFTIDVVEGKTWLADANLATLLLGSQNGCEEKEKALRRLLDSLSAPWEKITALLALGQFKEAVDLAKGTEYERAAIAHAFYYTMADADAPYRALMEGTAPPPKPVSSEKVADALPSNGSDGPLETTYEPDQALPASVNALMARLSDAIGRRDTSAVLALYDWPRAELLNVRRDVEEKEWDSRLKSTSKLRGRIGIKCIDLSAADVWDALPEGVGASVRVLTARFLVGKQKEQVRLVIDVGEKESRLLRWPWVAGLPPLAMRHLERFGLTEQLDIPVPADLKDGKSPQVSLRSVVLDKLGIQQATLRQKDLSHQVLAMMIGGPQRNLPVFLCRLRYPVKEGQPASEWTYSLVFRIKEDGLHLAAFLPVEDVSKWSVDLIDWKRLPPLELRKADQ